MQKCYAGRFHSCVSLQDVKRDDKFREMYRDILKSEYINIRKYAQVSQSSYIRVTLFSYSNFCPF